MSQPSWHISPELSFSYGLKTISFSPSLVSVAVSCLVKKSCKRTFLFPFTDGAITVREYMIRSFNNGELCVHCDFISLCNDCAIIVQNVHGYNLSSPHMKAEIF